MAPIAAWTSSTDRALTRVVVGRVVGAHGLRGQLKVRDFTDGPETFLGIPCVFLSEGDRQDAAGPDHDIQAASPGRRGEIRLTLKGVNDRASAEALRGRLVWADSAHLVPLEPGEYYGYQLVGCRAEDTEGTPLGTVREVWATGGADTLVIEDAMGRDQLIPAAESFLKSVDVPAQRIVVALLPGLLEAGPATEGPEAPTGPEERCEGRSEEQRDEEKEEG
jgi:16S rRNA processing protein RimM